MTYGVFHIMSAFVNGASSIRMPRQLLYRGAVKSLARPGRKQTNVSLRRVCISFGALLCKGEKKKT